MATTSASSATATTTKTNILTTLGAGSGVDTKTLAESLVEATRAPRQERIDAKIAKTEARISGYGTLKFVLGELKTAFQGLNDAKDFQSIKVGNTQPAAVTVTAGASATAGRLNLAVTQLASARQFTTGNLGARTDPLNGGSAFTLNLSVGGGAAKPIEIKTATPEGMANAINGANLGLSAQVINTGSGVQVVVTGQQGTANDFTLTPAAPVTGLDFNTSLQEVADAKFNLNGIDIVRSNNSVSDVLDGVTFELAATTAGTARVDLTRDTGAIKTRLQALVTAYNQFDDAAKALGSRAPSEDEEDKITSSLAGDSVLQSLRANVRELVTGTSRSPGATIQAARNVGLSIDREGKMVLDEIKLDKALASNFSEVVQMFTANVNDQSIYSDAPGGVAGDAVKAIDKLVRATGTIAAQTENANTDIKRHQADLTRLKEQMDSLLARYTRQFAAMDSLVGDATATRASLKSTFDAWNKSN